MSLSDRSKLFESVLSGVEIEVMKVIQENSLVGVQLKDKHRINLTKGKVILHWPSTTVPVSSDVLCASVQSQPGIPKIILSVYYRKEADECCIQFTIIQAKTKSSAQQQPSSSTTVVSRPCLCGDNVSSVIDAITDCPDDSLRRRRLEVILTAFKNTAYARGFAAASSCQK